MNTTGTPPEVPDRPAPSGPRPPEPGRWGPVSAPPSPAAGAAAPGAAAPGAGPALGGAYGEPSGAGADSGRWVLPETGQVLLRALDPRLTGRLRAERTVLRTLAARPRRGSSVAVLGTWPPQQAAVCGLLALAVARFHGPDVLAVDASADAGMARRLADRPEGSTEALLAGLAIRGAGADQPPPVVPARRWLRQRLGIAAGVQLLAGDPARGEPRLRGGEYDAVVGLLRRYVTLFVTHAPPPEGERIVEAVVRRADRVLLVLPDGEAGQAGLREWLPWLDWAGHGSDGGTIVLALTPAGSARSGSGRSGSGPARSALAGLPAVRLPGDPVLSGTGRLRWNGLAAPTRRAALVLAGTVLRGLAERPPGQD